MSRVSVPRDRDAHARELTADPAEIRRATVGTTQIRHSNGAAAALTTIQRLRCNAWWPAAVLAEALRIIF
jgi:hypothetical protein